MPTRRALWSADAWREHLDLRRVGVAARARLRQGVRRVRGALVPILQAAIGAGASWLVAHDVLHHPLPIFAPIATWVCLGFTENRVPRKVAELGVGATLGVLIGEGFVLTVGASWWSIPLAVVCGALLGRLLDRGDLLTMQAAVNAMVVLGMSSGPVVSGTFGTRWAEALIGAGVAFLIAVLLPRHPAHRPQRYARASLEEFAASVKMLSDGLQAGDVEQLRDLTGQLRATDQVLSDWEASLKTSTDIVQLNPTLRADRVRLAELNRMYRLLRRAQSVLDMLARQSLGLTEQVGRMPVVGGLSADVADALTALAGSVGGWARPDNAREQLASIAGRSRPAEMAREDWRPAALVSLLRALVVDLLRVAGLSLADARTLLPDHGNQLEAGDDELARDEGPSTLWG